MSATLPPGWAWVPVGDLVAVPSDLTDGPFGSNLKTEHYRDSGPRVVRLQNIGNGRYLDDEAHISTTHFARLRKHQAIPGDVVVAMLGSDLPRACLVPPSLGPAIVKADCVRLRPDDRIIDGRYAVAALSSHAVRHQAERLVHGVGRPRLGLKWFRDLRVPLAPIAEQARLVDAVDSHLSRLDAAVATVEAAQRKLKAYRASVLKAAAEGRLVPTEAKFAMSAGRDYEAADVLLERILKERRRRWEEAERAKMRAVGKTPKDDRWKQKYSEPEPPDLDNLPGLPEGWCWATIDQISTLVRNGHPTPPRASSGVRTLRISAVRPLAINFQDVRYLPGHPSEYEDDLVDLDDLLFTRYNGTPALVGVCGRVRFLDRDTVHPDKLIKVRLVDLAMSAFVEIASNTGMSRRHVELRTRTTAGQAGISGADLKRMPIPLPPQAEQERICSSVDTLLTIDGATRRDIESALRRCAALRNSVLKSAFEGGLVDQDLRDEPADALLARVREERAATAPAISKARRPRKLRAS